MIGLHSFCDRRDEQAPELVHGFPTFQANKKPSRKLAMAITTA
jgi:hypothetical protein